MLSRGASYSLQRGGLKQRRCWGQDGYWNGVVGGWGVGGFQLVEGRGRKGA
jgi:hypothetical protein